MPDLIVVLVIALVVVLMWRGPRTLPKWGEALGRGVREARTEATKVQAEIQARASGEAGAGGAGEADTGAAATGTPGAGDRPDPDRPA